MHNKFKRQNIFQRLFSFSGKIGRGEFWSELLTRLISLICMAIVLCFVIVSVVPGDTEHLTRVTDAAMPFLLVLWAVPVVALTRRRLRDAGFSAKSYLWLLLPVVGWVIFVVRLCRDSAE